MGWTAADLPGLEGRTFLVTGANSGIGLAAARELARAGARVVLAARDPARGERAAATIPGDREVRPLDLADLASVRAFAEDWDGDVDVTVSSSVHRAGRIRLDDLNWERRRYDRWRAYAQSKLANLLFTLELQRRLAAAGSTVRAVAAHPGWAATNLQGRTEQAVQNALLVLGNRIFAQSDELGALPTLYAATQDIPGGSYVGPDGWQEQRGHPRLVGRSRAASDAQTARRLWELSERLTGTSFALTPAPA